MSMDGKAILVTGEGRGIGRAIALRLSKDGTDVALVDAKDDKIDTWDEVRRSGRNATTFSADATERDQVYAAIDHAEREREGFGDVDV